MDNSGLIGIFEPKCKIRFLSDPHPQEEYIAISAEDYKALLTDSMRLRALECGGVDDWNWYGESISDFKEELLNSYDDNDAFWQWVEHMKSNEQTCEEYVNKMTIKDFAGFEVDMML